MIEKFFVRDVKILHPVLVDSGYHSSDETFDPDTAPTVKGWLSALVVLRGAEVESSTRDTSLGRYVLRLPAGTAIDERCRVMIDGDTYEVEGFPDPRWTPRGEHHVRCLLQRVDG